MAAAAWDLTTLANIKAFLGITGSSDDTLLQTLISAYSAAVVNFLGRNPVSATYTAKYHGTGTSQLFLKNSPITAVTALIINGASVPASNGVSFGYVFDNHCISLIGGSSYNSGLESLPSLSPAFFPRGNQNVVITYTAGVSANSAAYAAISQLALEAVAKSYKMKERIGQKSEGAVGQSTIFDKNWIDEGTKALLDSYKSFVPVQSFGD